MDTEQKAGRVRRVIGWLWRRRLRVAGVVGLALVAGYGVTFALVEHATSPTDRAATLDDGRSLAYRLREADGPVRARVVLVHGAPANATSWDVFIRRAAAELPGCEFVVVDRLGYGNSTPGAETSLHEHARSLAPLLECETPVVLVGHSFGGPVVVRAGAEFPDRVGAIVVAAGACDPDMNDSQWLRRAIDGVAPVVPTPWEVGNLELLALTDENNAMRREGLLDNVRCPVAIVHGEWDPVCPHDGTVAYLTRSLTSSADVRVDSLARTGHNVHLSSPTRLAESIRWAIGHAGAHAPTGGVASREG